MLVREGSHHRWGGEPARRNDPSLGSILSEGESQRKRLFFSEGGTITEEEEKGKKRSRSSQVSGEKAISCNGTMEKGGKGGSGHSIGYFEKVKKEYL